MTSMKPHLAALVINAIALMFLYQATRFVDTDLRYRQLGEIHDLKTESLLLDRDLFKLNFSQLNNYDTLADAQQRRHHILEGLTNTIEGLAPDKDIKHLVSKAVVLASQAERAIDLIKRAHSQLKNSQTYFPVLVQDLVQQSASLADGDNLASSLSHLRDLVAIHAFVQSADTLAKVEDILLKLQARATILAADQQFLDDLNHALEHARIITTQVGKVRDLVEAHLRSDFSSVADQIYDHYALTFAREQAYSQGWFPLYYGVLLVLVGQVALMFLQLFRTNQRVVQQSKELQSRLDRESQLNGLQRQFVSMVSHEFRTPLAIIDGHAQRIERRLDTVKPEALERALSKIRLSIRRLIELMESVLSAAHLEAGKIKFEPELCNLAAIVTEVTNNHAEINPGYSLILDVNESMPPLLADSRLLRQIISNLISNAIKYSDPGSRVWVKNSLNAEGEIEVSVQDEGLGIPAEEQAKLFDRFFRASTSVGIAGSGIGLHLAQHLASLHHGQIDFESQVGKGSTFLLRLPASLFAVEEKLDAVKLLHDTARMNRPEALA